MSLEMPTEEWKKPTPDFHLDPTKVGEGSVLEQVVRDTAIESAEINELEEAVGRMEDRLQQEPRDADTLAALTQVRDRLDKLIRSNQN